MDFNGAFHSNSTLKFTGNLFAKEMIIIIYYYLFYSNLYELLNP